MNYTEKYHLPQWEENDRIMRTDFNSAMSDIESGIESVREEGNQRYIALNAKDADLHNRIVAADQKAAAAYSPSQKPYTVGSYTGSGEEVTVTLGFKPSFLIINGLKDGRDGLGIEEYGQYCAMTAGKSISKRVRFTDTGFVLKEPDDVNYRWPLLIENGRKYDYIAFR